MNNNAASLVVVDLASTPEINFTCEVLSHFFFFAATKCVVWESYGKKDEAAHCTTHMHTEALISQRS